MTPAVRVVTPTPSNMAISAMMMRSGFGSWAVILVAAWTLRMRSFANDRWPFREIETPGTHDEEGRG